MRVKLTSIDAGIQCIKDLARDLLSPPVKYAHAGGSCQSILGDSYGSSYRTAIRIEHTVVRPGRCPRAHTPATETPPHELTETPRRTFFRGSKGETIDEIKNFFGDVIATIQAPADGVVAVRRAVLPCSTGDRLISVFPEVEPDTPPPQPPYP